MPKSDDALTFAADALDFGSGGGLFDDPPGPQTGTAAADHGQFLGGVSAEFKERAKAEAARFRTATDSEYWFAVVFETREQKEAFLKAMGWLKLHDKYFDGVELAEKQRIKLPPAALPYTAAKPDRKLDALSLPLDAT